MNWELCLHGLQYKISLYIQWTDGNTGLFSVVNTVIMVDFKDVEWRPSTNRNLNQIMIFVN
jgi:hypothetical protein